MKRRLVAMLCALVVLSGVCVAVASADPGADVPRNLKAADLNGDGRYTVADMQALYEYLTFGRLPNNVTYREEIFHDIVADANSDGIVNILDYEALYHFVLYQIDEDMWSPSY